MAQSKAAAVSDTVSDAVSTSPETVTGTLVEEPPQKTHPALRLMIQTMAIEAELPGGASDDFVMDIMESILSAESEEDIFEAQKSPTMAGKDFSGRPFFLADDDITIRKSTLEKSGLPFYALFKVTEIATGEEFVLNCGGQTLMAVLHSLRSHDYFLRTEEFPLGRSVVIMATPSPAGAYLSLRPYKVAVPSRGKQTV